MKKVLWTASSSEEWWPGFDCETREEAIEMAHTELDLVDGDTFFIGTQDKPEVNYENVLCLESFLDSLLDQNETVFGEWAESWVEKVRKSKGLELFLQIKEKEIGVYIEKNMPPTFFLAGNMEELIYKKNA